MGKAPEESKNTFNPAETRKQKNLRNKRPKYEAEIKNLLEAALAAYFQAQLLIWKFNKRDKELLDMPQEEQPQKTLGLNNPIIRKQKRSLLGFVDAAIKPLNAIYTGLGETFQPGDNPMIKAEIKKIEDKIAGKKDAEIAGLAKSLRKYKIRNLEKIFSKTVKIKKEFDELVGKNKKSPEEKALLRIIVDRADKVYPSLINYSVEVFVNNHLKAIFGSGGILDKVIAVEKSKLSESGGNSGLIKNLETLKTYYKELKVNLMTFTPPSGDNKTLKEQQNCKDEIEEIIKQIKPDETLSVPDFKNTSSPEQFLKEFMKLIGTVKIHIKKKLEITKSQKERRELIKAQTQLKLLSRNIKKIYDVNNETHKKADNYINDVINKLDGFKEKILEFAITNRISTEFKGLLELVSIKINNYANALSERKAGVIIGVHRTQQ